ncbi:MAG: hypothetical protein LBR56_05525 [Sporomusaceae bacterium]|jgi:hypothetical protein|nr:hypothetical protein [Sporomusaceae bacterium]
MSDELGRSIEELWRDYEFLTKEISKFIDQRDENMVTEFLSQRNKMEKFITEKNDQTYHKTPEGKALIESILALNKDAASRLQQRYNNLKQQHKVFIAYEGETISAQPRHYLDKDM